MTPKIFWSYTNEFKYNLTDKLDFSQSIDILTSEDTKNTPLESRIAYEYFLVKHSCLYNKRGYTLINRLINSY